MPGRNAFQVIGRILRCYVRSCIRSFGYDIVRINGQERRVSRGNVSTEPEQPYNEGHPVGPVNISEKIKRAKDGGPFEWPDIIALNEAAKKLIGDAQSIAEYGCGTGKFISVARDYPDRLFYASEFDVDALNWAKKRYNNISNIEWFPGSLPTHLSQLDLVVSLDVVEHIWDHTDFLRMMARSGRRAVLSTPNRSRSNRTYHVGPPEYPQHVREWTAGEFYWTLRCFWQKVELYSTTDQFSSDLIKIDVDSRCYHLIANCQAPIAREAVSEGIKC